MHMFHDTAGPANDPLAPYHIVHLPLQQIDVDELSYAYITDSTLVHSVPLSDIYKVITGHPSASTVPALHQQCALSWKNKRFFAVPSPTGSGTLLYAPSSSTVNAYKEVMPDDDQQDRHLVLVAPAGANVQITTLDRVTDAGSGHHYADHDLRRDVLLHCHDNGHHTSLTNTQKHVHALV